MDEVDGSVSQNSLTGIMDSDYQLFKNNNTYCSTMCVSPCSKKRKIGAESCSSTQASGCQSIPRRDCFLHIKKSENVYMTDNWQGPKTSLFVPLSGDLFINTLKYDQLNILEGSFFIGDDQGKYSGSGKGKCLNLWKYDKASRHFYIVQSFLFTSLEDFLPVQQHLMS